MSSQGLPENTKASVSIFTALRVQALFCLELVHGGPASCQPPPVNPLGSEHH